MEIRDACCEDLAKDSKMSVSKNAFKSAKHLDDSAKNAITAIINANKKVDQALAVLQQATNQAVTLAESAVAIANSALNSMCASKKEVDNFNFNNILTKTERDLNIDDLQQSAKLAACTAFATLHEIKDTVCAARATMVEATSAKNDAIMAIRVTKEAAGKSAASAKVEMKKKLVKSTSDSASEYSQRIALKLADQAESSFLVNMSHEIRTPLAAIVGFAEIVSGEVSDKNNNSEISGHVGAILRNSKHLLALINDVLDISKIDSGVLERENNSISIREELNQVVQMLSVKAHRHNDNIIIHCPNDFPWMITTDPTKLRQILINLISNAIKFTEHGTIKINVDYVTGTDINGQGFFKIQIIDPGIGIAPSNQAKLFSSYGQVDQSTSRRFGGTGLGLMLAKKLARFLGGDVYLAKSSLGFGSTFEIQLPLVIAENLKPTQENNLQPFSNTDSSIKGCRVLLAEDSSDMQNLVGHIIKSHGGDVKFAKNGRDAIEKASGGQFDMILMDVEMPVLDGNEANKQLRKKGLKVPIIAFTAHAFYNKEHFNDAVYDDYLTKPITSNQLLKTIKRWYQPQQVH